MSFTRRMTCHRQILLPGRLLTRNPPSLFVCKLISDKSEKMIRFRLFPFRSPLLRESLLLSFPRGTKMFQFPHLPSKCTIKISKERSGSYTDDRALPLTGFPIRKSSGYNVCSTTPRGFSQSTTSFFGVLCQGIHHAPFSNFLCIWVFVSRR